MQIRQQALAISLVILLLLVAVPSSQAQGEIGPLVIIHDTPDTTTAPPEVRIPITIVDRETAQTIRGLTADNFQIEEAGAEIETLNVSRESNGLAIAVVVDRRSISALNDPRIGKAVSLVQELISRLSITGAAHDDMIALIGVAKNGVLEPEIDFTFDSVDTNLINNTLVMMEQDTIGGSEGISVFAKVNNDGQLEVIEAYEGGPAEQAGILTGDHILAVDGISIVGSTLAEAADLICGSAGTEVKLLVKREGIPGPFEATAVRSRSVITGGIGASMQMDSNGELEIVNTSAGSPIEQAGVSAGDHIIEIDSIPVAGSTLQEAVSLIRGSAGTNVTILIKRRGETEPFEVTLTREPVAMCDRIAYSPPLPYEGLDEAIQLLTANSSVTVQNLLSHHRKIIILLSGDIAPHYTNIVRESYIIRKANDANISIYPIGIAWHSNNLIGDDNLQRLATYTNGLYTLHNNEETQRQILDLFDHLMTQRQQYIVTYNTRQPKGNYPLSIEINTDVGSAKESTSFFSTLEIPKMMLTSPSEESNHTVPYSQSIKGFETITIPLGVEITPMDNAPHTPSEVSYFANGAYIGASTAPPNFIFDWNVNELVSPIEDTQIQKLTLVAEADDPYLGQRIQSSTVNIQITWEQETLPFTKRVPELLTSNWLLILSQAILMIGELVLFILLIRTRGEVARKVVARTTGVLKGVTRQLGAMPQKAPGKLVVIQGANMGKEFRLAAQVVKVGRDPQFCDFALYDEYASNPHFSVQLEQTQFYVTDEGSTNGTRVNGMPISPHKRMLLQPDAIIEVGQTRLQFKRLGGTTRQLGAQFDSQSEVTQPMNIPTGPGPWEHPPTQPAPPPASGAVQQPKPTRQVYD